VRDFSSLPINVREAILSGNREALSAMGRRGAKARARKRMREEQKVVVPDKPDGKMKAAHDE